MKPIHDFHMALKRASKLQEINDCLKNYLNDHSIDTFVMTCYYKTGQRNNTPVYYSYVSESFKKWHDFYHLSGYDQIDTTTYDTKLSELPVFWEIHDQIDKATTQIEYQMRLDALEFGADCGLSIPLHASNGERAILMISQKQGQLGLKNWQIDQYEFLAAAYYYYGFLRHQLVKEAPLESCHVLLNKRQKQCLELISQGLRLPQIADKLCITERTVNYHIQKINKRLAARNKHESVAIAKEEGIIA